MGLGCEAERSVCALANQVMVESGKKWEPEMVAMIPEGRFWSVGIEPGRDRSQEREPKDQANGFQKRGEKSGLGDGSASGVPAWMLARCLPVAVSCTSGRKGGEAGPEGTGAKRTP